MLTALDASPRALERIGDWQIVGNNGHIMTDGTKKRPPLLVKGLPQAFPKCPKQLIAFDGV
jgi:hypothetical protein